MEVAYDISTQYHVPLEAMLHTTEMRRVSHRLAHAINITRILVSRVLQPNPKL